MMDEFSNIEQIIKEQKITRRELEKFWIIVKNYQPNNDSLLVLLSHNIIRNINRETLYTFEKTIDALLQSLDYPVDEIKFDDKSKYNGYKLVKDCIIEYCVTDINDMSMILDNVSFLNRKPIKQVEKEMQLYMSSYGDSQKIVNAYNRYSEDKNNINKSILPDVYIPIFSKAVVEKIKEMKAFKNNESEQHPQGNNHIRIV